VTRATFLLIFVVARASRSWHMGRTDRQTDRPRGCNQ